MRFAPSAKQTETQQTVNKAEEPYPISAPLNFNSLKVTPIYYMWNSRQNNTWLKYYNSIMPQVTQLKINFVASKIHVLDYYLILY